MRTPNPILLSTPISQLTLTQTSIMQNSMQNPVLEVFDGQYEPVKLISINIEDGRLQSLRLGCEQVSRSCSNTSRLSNGFCVIYLSPRDPDLPVEILGDLVEKKIEDGGAIMRTDGRNSQSCRVLSRHSRQGSGLDDQSMMLNNGHKGIKANTDCRIHIFPWP